MGQRNQSSAPNILPHALGFRPANDLAGPRYARRWVVSSGHRCADAFATRRSVPAEPWHECCHAAFHRIWSNR